MVPRPEVPGAVALNSMGFNIARSVGPAIGGAIVAAAGAAAAFAVNAASYISLLTVLARWRPPTRTRSLPRETLGIAMAAGVRYVAMSPVIRTVLVRSAIFGFGASSILALMPLVAKHLVEGGPLTYGLLLGAFGAGAVTGALSAARLRDLLSTEAIVRWAGCILRARSGDHGCQHEPRARQWPCCCWRRRLGAEPFDFQRDGAVVRAALGRRARVVALSDGAFGGLAAGSWLWGEVAAHVGITMHC